MAATKKAQPKRVRTHRRQFQVQDAEGKVVAVSQSKREATALAEKEGLKVVPSRERITDADTAAAVTQGNAAERARLQAIADQNAARAAEQAVREAERAADLAMLAPYLADNQLNVQAAVQAGVEEGVLGRVGITGDVIKTVKQNLSDLAVLSPYLKSDNKIDLQAAVEAGVDQAILDRAGVSGESLQAVTQRIQDIAAVSTFLTDDQIQLQAALRSGADQAVLERLGVSSESITTSRQNIADLEALAPYLTEDKVDLQSALEAGIDRAILARVGVSAESIQTVTQRMQDIAAVSPFLTEDQIQLQAALEAGADQKVLERLGISVESIDAARQNMEDLAVLAPYIQDGRIDTQAALEAGVAQAILERVGVSAGSIAASRQSSADLLELNPFLSADQKLDIEAAIKKGIKGEVLERVGIPPATIEASRQHIADLTLLAPFITEDQIKVEDAIRAGIGQDVLERVGIAGTAIAASQQNITDLEAVQPYLTADGKLNVKAAVEAGVPSEVLTRIGITSDALKDVAQHIADLTVLAPYIKDGLIDVQAAIQSGVPQALLQRVGVAQTSIQEINQNIADLAILAPYINDTQINLQAAVNAGVDKEVLARVGITGDDISEATQTLADIKILGPYLSDDQINVDAAIRGGVSTEVLTRVGVTLEGIASVQQSISDRAAIDPFLSEDGKTVNINLAIDSGIDVAILQRLGLPVAKPDKVSLLPVPSELIKADHINDLRRGFAEAQEAVLRGVSGGDDLANAQRLAKLRVDEFWRERGYDLAGMRTAYQDRSGWFGRAISSAQGHIYDNNAKVGARRGAISRATADYRNNLWRERIVMLQQQQADRRQALQDFDRYSRALNPFLQETINESLAAIPQIVGNLAGAKNIRDTTRTTPELQASITEAGGVSQAIAAGTLSRQEAVSLGVSDSDVTSVLRAQIPQAVNFPEGTRFQLLDASGQSAGFTSGQAGIDVAVQQGFTVQPVTLVTQAIPIPTAAELRAMPSPEAEAIRTATISPSQQLRVGIGPGIAPEDFEGGLDEPRQQISLRLESAGVLNLTENTIDIPEALAAGFTSQEIQTATGLGPIAIAAAQQQQLSAERLGAGEALQQLSAIPRVPSTEAIVVHPVSLEFDRVIAEQNQLVNALAQVQGPIPAGFEFESQKIDAITEVRDAVNSGKLSNEEGLKIVQDIRVQGATAELSDLGELVPGYGDLVRFNRAREAGFAVPETFAFGVGAALNLLIAASVVKGVPVVFRATTGRLAASRLAGKTGPLSRVHNIDYATTSGPAAARLFAEGSKEIPHTTLSVEASTAPDLAHITRATALKAEMVKAVLENRNQAGIARTDVISPTPRGTGAPTAVEIMMKPDPEVVQGAVNLETLFNAADPVLGEGVFTNRVIVIEGPLAAQRIAEFASAARATNWDTVTIRTIAKQGDNLPHLAGNELAKVLRKNGIKVIRDGQVITEITPTAEGTSSLTEAPRSLKVILRAEKGPEQISLESGRSALGPGEVLVETDPATRTGTVSRPMSFAERQMRVQTLVNPATEPVVSARVVEVATPRSTVIVPRQPSVLPAGNAARIIERLNPTIRQDLTVRLGQTRAIEILHRLGITGDQPAITTFTELTPAEIEAVVEIIEEAVVESPELVPEGLSPSDIQSIRSLFDRSRPVIQTRLAAETSFAERQMQLRELVDRSFEDVEPPATIEPRIQTLEPFQRVEPGQLAPVQEGIPVLELQRQVQAPPARVAEVAERVVTPEREAQLADLQRFIDTSVEPVSQAASVAVRDVRVEPLLARAEPLLDSSRSVERAAAATLLELLPTIGTRTLNEVEVQDIRDAASVVFPPEQQQSLELIIGVPQRTSTIEPRTIGEPQRTTITGLQPFGAPQPSPLDFEERQPAPVPAPGPAPAPAPAPFTEPGPFPAPAPTPEPTPQPQPQPQPFPEPGPSPITPPSTIPVEGPGEPPRPPRPPRGSDEDEEEEVKRRRALNLRIAGINRGFLDTTVDFASGEVTTVPDLISVPEGPTRLSFTPLSFSEAEPALQRIPWGANDLILGPGGSFKWIKAKSKLPEANELLPASEFGNGNGKHKELASPKRSRGRGMLNRSSVSIRRRGSSL